MGPDGRAVHRWYRRYGKLGAAGLRDGASPPLHSPRALPAAIVEKILYLRRYYG